MTSTTKHSRQDAIRPPSLYTMVTILVFIVLIGGWFVRSDPPQQSPAVSRKPESTVTETEIQEKTEDGDDLEAFLENVGNIAVENEQKLEEGASWENNFPKLPDEELSVEQVEQVTPVSITRSDTSINNVAKISGQKFDKIRERTVVSEREIVALDSDSKVDKEVASKQEDNDFFADKLSVEKKSDVRRENQAAAMAEIETESEDGTNVWPTQENESKVEKEKVKAGEKEDYSAGEEESEGKEEKREEIKSDAEAKVIKMVNADTDNNDLSLDDEIEEPINRKKFVKVKSLQTVDGTDELVIQSGDVSIKSHNSAEKEMEWKICDVKGATDYIPCLDNMEAIKALPSTKHYEHRERHCPSTTPTCLVPIPEGYRAPIHWPKSRREVWYRNVPHPGLISYKKYQNWVQKWQDRLIFPGEGTQFRQGALHYIDLIEEIYPNIAWGKRTRVVLDVGCGVASFGGYMFDRDVLTMSFAPKDEHEAQVQFALERGIPAISSVMGTQRLVFPSNVFDAVHCARCRVPWHIEGGKLLLELNRVLRPGGFFVWSATPVYLKEEEDVMIWKAMKALTASICWKLVAKARDASTGIGVAIFRKPMTNYCYMKRMESIPVLCNEDNKPDAAWYVPMTACIHKLPSDDGARGTKWPKRWPLRLISPSAWLNGIKLYGKPGDLDFSADLIQWQNVVQKLYLHGLGIDWKAVRNVMDMRATYGGFAAALVSEEVWVMNVVQFDGVDTLRIIFDRGLFGLYHDWCESFSSYPRTYDLLHADHLFSSLKQRCDIVGIIAEMDRLLRPGGWTIVRDSANVVEEVKALAVSLRWDVQTTDVKGGETVLAARKGLWRPEATA